MIPPGFQEESAGRPAFSPCFFEDSRVSESSSVGRASAFQAEGREFEPRLSLHLFKGAFMHRPSSSGVERFLGKEEGMGSNPISGSITEHLAIGFSQV